VDSGICSSGNDRRDFDAADRRQRFFQIPLNGPYATVAGEPVEPGTVVAEFESKRRQLVPH